MYRHARPYFDRAGARSKAPLGLTRRSFVAGALFALSGLVVSGGSTAAPALAAQPAATPAEQQFDDLVHEIVLRVLQTSTYYVNSYLEDPESFGIDRSSVPDVWDIFSYGPTSAAIYTDLLQGLHEIDRSSMGGYRAGEYDSLDRGAQICLELCNDKFYGYEQLFDGMQDIHVGMVSALDRFEVRDEQDALSLLGLVQSGGDALKQALDYLHMQLDAGTFTGSPVFTLQATEQIMTSEYADELFSGMVERVNAVAMGDADRQALLYQLEDAFYNAFWPVIGDIYNEFEPLASYETPYETVSPSDLEHGREYFELGWRLATSSDMSVDEGFELLRQHLLSSEQQSLRSLPAWLLNRVDASEGAQDYSDVIEGLLVDIEGEFPEFSGVDFNIEDGDPALMTGTLGYLEIPCIDYQGTWQMRMNPDESEISSGDTFMTIAHEGVPGHLYQMSYLYQNLNPEILVLTDDLAYIEGYATYAEARALEYVEGASQGWIEHMRAELVSGRCFDVMLDIGFNYYGWSLTQTIRQIHPGLADVVAPISDVIDDALHSAFNSIMLLEEPYIFGYLQFMALREKAESALGDAFDETAFHQALIANGVVNFEVLGQHVDAYIDQVLAQM